MDEESGLQIDGGHRLIVGAGPPVGGVGVDGELEGGFVRPICDGTFPGFQISSIQVGLLVDGDEPVDCARDVEVDVDDDLLDPFRVYPDLGVDECVNIRFNV